MPTEKSMLTKEIPDVYSFLRERAEKFVSHVRAKGVDLPDASCLRHCVRALDGGPALALDADGAPAPEVDEKAMTATFVISTLAKDRAGDIVLPRGCEKLLPKNYARNPRVFFSHKSRDLPVGSSRTPEGHLDLEVQDTFVKATCHFHGETPESDLVFKLVKRGELQAASIGFLPVKAAILEVEKEPERPETNEHGEDLVYFGDGSGWFPSLRFHEWDLTEWSIVPVPANAECIAMHLSRGHVEGQPLTASLKKSLEPWATPRKVWSPGALLLEIGEEVKAQESPEVQEVKEEITATETGEELEKELDFSPGELVPDGTPLLGPENIPPAFPEDLAHLLGDGYVLFLEGGVLQYERREHVEKMDELIAQPQVGTPEEDPMKGWPLGAKFLSKAMGHCKAGEDCVDSHDPEMEHPRVKRQGQRLKARLGKVRAKLQKLASEVYPDKFAAPEESPPEVDGGAGEKALRDALTQAKSPALPTPGGEALSPGDLEEIRLALDLLCRAQEDQARALFELTGLEVTPHGQGEG